MSLKSAYKSSGAVFEQVSKLQSPGLYERLKAIEPGEIVVVKGQYDHIEKLVDTLKVPYKLIGQGDFEESGRGRVMFVNCATYSGANKRVADFVEKGGRLITTDWSLGLITATFSGYLHKTKETTEDVVEVQCDSPLAKKLLGLHYAQCHPKWWLEGSSHIYSIKKEVTPIITSAEMKTKYGQPFVAVGFNYGNGDVFHFISHLELQRTHLRTKEDEGGLDDFLAKMNAERTSLMEEANVGELEAAYSTLNTLAHLCISSPLLEKEIQPLLAAVPPATHTGKSILVKSTKK